MIVVNQNRQIVDFEGEQYALVKYKAGRSFVQVSMSVPMANALDYIKKFTQTAGAQPLTQTIVVDGVKHSGNICSFKYDAGRYSLKRLLQTPTERMTKIEIKIMK